MEEFNLGGALELTVAHQFLEFIDENGEFLQDTHMAQLLRNVFIGVNRHQHNRGYLLHVREWERIRTDVVVIAQVLLQRINSARIILLPEQMRVRKLKVLGVKEVDTGRDKNQWEVRLEKESRSTTTRLALVDDYLASRYQIQQVRPFTQVADGGRYRYFGLLHGSIDA